MSKRLRAARVAYDPVQAQVARDLDMQVQTLNKYETGKRFPDEYFLVKFHQLTKCPIDWIFLGKITSEMPAKMAARIAVVAPELVSETPLSAQIEAEGREKVS